MEQILETCGFFHKHSLDEVQTSIYAISSHWGIKYVSDLATSFDRHGGVVMLQFYDRGYEDSMQAMQDILVADPRIYVTVMRNK